MNDYESSLLSLSLKPPKILDSKFIGLDKNKIFEKLKEDTAFLKIDKIQEPISFEISNISIEEESLYNSDSSFKMDEDIQGEMKINKMNDNEIETMDIFDSVIDNIKIVSSPEPSPTEKTPKNVSTVYDMLNSFTRNSNYTRDENIEVTSLENKNQENITEDSLELGDCIESIDLTITKNDDVEIISSIYHSVCNQKIKYIPFNNFELAEPQDFYNNDKVFLNYIFLCYSEINPLLYEFKGIIKSILYASSVELLLYNKINSKYYSWSSLALHDKNNCNNILSSFVIREDDLSGYLKNIDYPENENKQFYTGLWELDQSFTKIKKIVFLENDSRSYKNKISKHSSPSLFLTQPKTQPFRITTEKSRNISIPLISRANNIITFEDNIIIHDLNYTYKTYQKIDWIYSQKLIHKVELKYKREIDFFSNNSEAKNILNKVINTNTNFDKLKEGKIMISPGFYIFNINTNFYNSCLQNNINVKKSNFLGFLFFGIEMKGALYLQEINKVLLILDNFKTIEMNLQQLDDIVTNYIFGFFS
ncbi:hypothetical protein [Carp edema virus]|nr:hypothetical protein [Carp edema virus]